MAEEKAEAPEDVYDERRWWQILEDEKYLRPLTFYELKGEYENYCWVNFNIEITSKDWDYQVEWIRDWYAGEQCDSDAEYDASAEGIAEAAEDQRKTLEYWDALDELEVRLGRPLVLQDAIQENEKLIGRRLTEKELSVEAGSFDYWVEVCAKLIASAARDVAAYELAFQALCVVLFDSKENGLDYSEGEKNAAIKQHMTFEIWCELSEINEIGVKQSASDRTIKGHAKRYPAIAYIKSEWAEHREAYGGNKSAFARAYTRRLSREKGINVTERQMRDVWLLDNPVASNPDGL